EEIEIALADILRGHGANIHISVVGGAFLPRPVATGMSLLRGFRRPDALADGSARGDLLAHGGHHRIEQLRVITQVILRRLASLTDLLTVECQPRTFAVEHTEVGRHIDDRAFPGDAD